MKLKLTLEEAKQKARAYLKELHCGPTVLRVMWEAYGWENEELLWAGKVFMGGIAGVQEGPCGAVSGMAMVTGLRHRYTGPDKDIEERERQAAYNEAAALVKDFKQRWGAITCRELYGFDFEDKEAIEKARQSGTFKPECENQVVYAIEKLYEREEMRG
jgi:C_GCAxxG_C_C family probable redox protein